MRISDIPITGKFLLIIALFGAFSITATIVASSQMKVIDEGYTAAAHQQGQAALFVSRGGSALRATKNAIEDLVISPTAAATQKALASLTKERRNLVDLLDHAKSADPTQSAAIDEIMRRDLDVIDKICANTVEAGSGISNPADALQAQTEYLNSCAPAYEPLTGSLRKQVETTSGIENSIEQELAARSKATVFWNYMFALAGTVLVSIAGFFAVRSWISKAINKLAGTMRRLAEGDLSVTVDGTSRRDEIGPMAKAVQIFKESNLRLQASEAEAARQRQATETERALNEATRSALQRQQQDVVDTLAKGLECLSKGDLNTQLGDGFPQDYEKLRADFNAAAASLKEAMSTIVAASNGISSGSDQIATASDDLSRRTEQQAASLEETAAALGMIMGTVNTMAANAKKAESAVLVTREAAETSGAVVLEAIGAMDQIKQSSTEISNIVSVIDEIAFQTNLLALNAGVEAARAGDAGRGFAVVASEVRGLAQRSAEAAKEIKSLISASSRKVEAGVQLVGKTGDALKDIGTRVGEIDHLMRQIAGAAKEQATGLAEINVAVGQMDQIVQQNAAMVEESTAAAHTLKSEVRGLTSMIGRFQIGSRPTARIAIRV